MMSGLIMRLLMVVGLETLGYCWGQSIPISPCPDKFKYQVDAGGMQYGLISVPPPEPDYNIKLTVKMALDAIPPTNYVGALHLVETKSEVWWRLITGDKRPVQYKLNFPLSSPLPLLKHISLNKKVICEGNPPSGMLTKISLEHNLFPIKLNSPQNQNQNTTVAPNNIPPVEHTEPTSVVHECGISARPIHLVVNGKTTERGEWPWLVAMYIKSKLSDLTFQCGGSLLSTNVVLTAAHCIKFKNQPEVKAESIVLYVGKHNLQEWTERNSQARDVKDIHVHPDYIGDGLEADLAILILKEPVQYTIHVQPICLWHFSSNITYIVGLNGTVVGWGQDETGKLSLEPNKVTMPIVSEQECRSSKKEITFLISNRTFCAGSRDGSGPCSGDSGGGFMIGYKDGDNVKWYLRGVVHISLRSIDGLQCDLRSYLIYTDVAQFMDWILKYVPY